MMEIKSHVREGKAARSRKKFELPQSQKSEDQSRIRGWRWRIVHFWHSVLPVRSKM
jgi:hypothetical protein